MEGLAPATFTSEAGIQAFFAGRTTPLSPRAQQLAVSVQAYVRSRGFTSPDVTLFRVDDPDLIKIAVGADAAATPLPDGSVIFNPDVADQIEDTARYRDGFPSAVGAFGGQALTSEILHYNWAAANGDDPLLADPTIRGIEAATTYAVAENLWPDYMKQEMGAALPAEQYPRGSTVYEIITAIRRASALATGQPYKSSAAKAWVSYLYRQAPEARNQLLAANGFDLSAVPPLGQWTYLTTPLPAIAPLAPPGRGAGAGPDRSARASSTRLTACLKRSLGRAPLGAPWRCLAVGIRTVGRTSG